MISPIPLNTCRYPGCNVHANLGCCTIHREMCRSHGIDPDLVKRSELVALAKKVAA